MNRLLLSTAMILSLLGLRAVGEPLAVGSVAPAVTGVTHSGEKLDFASLYAKGLVLVYFYPKADTPGCTAQGCSLRDAYADLTTKGVTVIGVSTDDVAAQAAFREKYHLPFTLIADKDQTVIKAFGVPVRDVPLAGAFASRQAFLIKDGRVFWRDLQAKTKEQAADVLGVLASIAK
jgi:thioredoxin-dependent peroxiredoxin